MYAEFLNCISLGLGDTMLGMGKWVVFVPTSGSGFRQSFNSPYSPPALQRGHISRDTGSGGHVWDIKLQWKYLSQPIIVL